MISSSFVLRSLHASLPALFAMLCATPAHAEMVLSQVIVDFQPDVPAVQDVEVWNAGEERIFVQAEPAEITAPGLPGEKRVVHPDPAELGLLVTPQRLVLEPGQRRIVRISAIAPRTGQERVFRVLVRPVSGQARAASSALKVLIGYDMLVLIRPNALAGKLTGERSGSKLTIRNDSNFAQELFQGSQCDPAGANCETLEARRLYPGATLIQNLRYATPVKYQATHGAGARTMEF